MPKKYIEVVKKEYFGDPGVVVAREEETASNKKKLAELCDSRKEAERCAFEMRTVEI